MEIVEAGRYEGTPKDDARAHLYLYDANGSFLQEVFYRSGMYSTGAMESGSYQAVWVRGGVNGWKLPHIADFAANAQTRMLRHIITSFMLIIDFQTSRLLI